MTELAPLVDHLVLTIHHEQLLCAKNHDDMKIQKVRGGSESVRKSDGRQVAARE